jgi:NAD(P)-dependent dehydrogenase (short-subunit alcohol dehydrogenase family)
MSRAQFSVLPDAAKALAAAKRSHPLGRLARAEEIAAAIEFLLSPTASFITGVTLPVDGGLSAKCVDSPIHPDLFHAVVTHNEQT